MQPNVIAALTEGPSHRFSDWPNPLVPRVAAGVYTIWRGGEFIYVGMSGRGLSRDQIAGHRQGEGRQRGIFTHLISNPLPDAFRRKRPAQSAQFHDGGEADAERLMSGT